MGTVALLILLGVVGSEPAVVLETSGFRYEIGADGTNLSFLDKASGKDFLNQQETNLCAVVIKEGKEYPATRVENQGVQYSVEFADAGVRALLKPYVQDNFVSIRLVDVSGENIDAITFLNVRLLPKEEQAQKDFIACALAQNLETGVDEIPGPNIELRARAYTKLGITKAQVAMVGSTSARVREILKEVVRSSPELPQYDQPIGGPWAMDAEINRGSYLFDFGEITENTVDEWIALAKSFGLNQIDFHTGKSLRFGDYTPNPDLFPKGKESLKNVLDRLHEAGIAAGLHTYAFFIAKDSPFVSPIPDPGLGKDATFTLAADLAENADTVPVEESVEKMSTITGFFVRNSVTLQIDNELIEYSGLNKQVPFAFTNCRRGAHGTQVAPHKKGAPVHHLKECFGLFAPDPHSDLFVKVAQHTADAFNDCGFDMIYLDALDGEDILGGPEFAWYYGSKFTFEIAKRLQRPALFEMSTFHHHLWYVRSRMGAWDCPSRGYRDFIDFHLMANRDAQASFLPTNLGWWAVQKWADGPRSTFVEPTYPEIIEYLLAKCIGSDSGFALIGISPASVKATPAYNRLAPLFQAYETLRHKKYFSEKIKTALCESGKDFTLQQGADGQWEFHPAQYPRHKVCGLQDGTERWTINNPFSPQPLRFRIETLMSVAPYDSPDVVAIEDFSSLEAYQHGFPKSQIIMNKTENGAELYASSNDETIPWAQVGRNFDPPLKLGQCAGLGVWIQGDGQGEVLNIQINSPEHTVYRALGEHYVNLDFTGWKYFELVELDSEKFLDYPWPLKKSNMYYPLFHMGIDYDQIASLNFWFNNLPSNKKAGCTLRPIHALPLVKNKICEPALTANGNRVTFPVAIESGWYLEYDSPKWTLYNPDGQPMESGTLETTRVDLRQGENLLEFSCAPTEKLNPRAYVTVMLRGNPLQN